MARRQSGTKPSPSAIGTKAVPTALRALRGDEGGKRPPAVEPSAPTLEHVEPPEDLSPIAAELWPQIADELASCGLLTTLDVTALVMLCEAYADWCMARAVVADFQAMVLDPSGRVVKRGGRVVLSHGSPYYHVVDGTGNRRVLTHPAVKVASDAESRLRAWMTEFGLTPSARARWRARGADESAAQPSEVDLSQFTDEELEAISEMQSRRRSDD